MKADRPIINFLRRFVFSRENLYAVLMALALIAIFTCATVGTQARFVYTGF